MVNNKAPGGKALNEFKHGPRHLQRWIGAGPRCRVVRVALGDVGGKDVGLEVVREQPRVVVQERGEGQGPVIRRHDLQLAGVLRTESHRLAAMVGIGGFK